MIRQNKTFLDWMRYIKSNYYASPEVLDIQTCRSFTDATIKRTLNEMKKL